MASVQCRTGFGDTTIDANLVVPAGETCELDGTTVTGDVIVKSGANLATKGARLGGPDSSLTVRRNAYADLTMTAVRGDVTVRRGYGLYAERSSFDGDLRARRGGFVYLYDSSMDADVRVGRNSSFMGEFVDVDGRVRGKNAEYVDIYDSALDGVLRVEDAASGAFLCSSHLESNARFQDNGDIVQVGGDGRVGVGCGGNTAEGDIRITDNRGDVVVQSNFVEGDLVCRYNVNAPTGADNAILGESRGQCADMEPTAQTRQRLADADDRRERHRAQARHLAQQRLG